RKEQHLRSAAAPTSGRPWSSGDKASCRESVYNGAPHRQHVRTRNGLRLELQHDTLPWPCYRVLNNNCFRPSGQVYIIVSATLVRCSAIRSRGRHHEWGTVAFALARSSASSDA